MLLLCHPCRCSDSEAGLGDLTKALMGVRALLDERIGTLRKKQEFDTDADFARRLQAELEQEDNRRQVVRPGCPGARQHQGAAVPVAVVVVLGFSRGAASAAAAARCSLPGACEAVLTLLVGPQAEDARLLQEFLDRDSTCQLCNTKEDTGTDSAHTAVVVLDECDHRVCSACTSAAIRASQPKTQNGYLCPVPACRQPLAQRAAKRLVLILCPMSMMLHAHQQRQTVGAAAAEVPRNLPRRCMREGAHWLLMSAGRSRLNPCAYCNA